MPKSLAKTSGLDSVWKELIKRAAKAQKNSYSPYSGYAVGAAVLTQTGAIYSGCNVENSTYGATTCAEQIAVFKAVSEGGKPTLLRVAIVTPSNPPAAPCGICRQVLREFGADIDVLLVSCDPGSAPVLSSARKISLAKLFGEAFTPEHLLGREPQQKRRRA